MADAIIIKGSTVTLREGRFNNPTQLLMRIGAMMKGRVQSTFPNQGRDGVTWKARRVPNIAGIVMDANRGARSIPKRRFEARPAAIDTSFLRRSISYGMSGPRTVRIGSTVQYANQVQHGGLRTIPITPQAKKILYSWIRPARKGRKKGVATLKDASLAGLGWLLGVDEITVNPPPRPFAFFSDRDRDDIGQIARDFFIKPDKKT